MNKLSKFFCFVIMVQNRVQQVFLFSERLFAQTTIVVFSTVAHAILYHTP